MRCCCRWLCVGLSLAWGGAARLPAADVPAGRAIRFEGLCDHGRPMTTKSPEAQAFFDQGLAFLYAFNHDEAIRSFEEAARLDPAAAMPHWGIAYASGPNINDPVVTEQEARAAWEALKRAQDLAATAAPMEQELITALAARYALPQPEDRSPLDRAYAEAMRQVWRRHPDDADVGALFAEALMDLYPWDLWSREGEPRPVTEEVLSTLEAVLAKSPRHPLALHLYIHAVEASPQPERAAQAADTLRSLNTRLGHLVHMPSHIDVLLGDWEQAIAANERALEFDRAYRETVPDQDFYRTYIAHNHHMLAFAAMMQGRSALATETVQTMLAEIPDAWLQEHAALVDAYFAMPYELHLRFGRWEEMLGAAEPAEQFPVARAVRLYARGVAFAALNNVAATREEQARFRAAVSQLPEGTLFLLNTAADVLAVADAVLEGEILYREGKVAAAVAELREAVRRETQLRYIEPPDWIQPARHVLGAVLSDAGRYAEAEQVYRDDLRRHPRNGWSLVGLGRALRAQGKLAEAERVDRQFQEAWKQADVPLTSSCLCLPGRPASPR